MTDILETAKNAGSFQTLVKAIEAADLTTTLQGEGPFTVLAPTDEAFANLPEGTLDQLLQDVPKLKRVVLYHVLFGDVRAEDLAEINEAPTVEGSIVAVDAINGGVKINNAQVLNTDVLADNGVIHTIDQVLIPALVEAE